jgi:CheY-like chemotaxis protein
VPPATPASAPGARVLFVDDEPALAEMARKALPRFGHVVTAFTNPQQAVEYFAADADDIDVVVTDLSMPQLSGFEVARLVRTVRAVPVILTTGWVRGQDEETARDAGIAELVLKPVSMSELSQTMARVLDAGDSAAASDVSVV